MSAIDTLIIVACHAIYNGGPRYGNDESEWLIEPFQEGETPTFIEHIRRGLDELVKTKGRGLLVFSGGATKKSKTGGQVTRTEAHGYNCVAHENDFFGIRLKGAEKSQGLSRFIQEENYATDSYQNVLLSLLQHPTWAAKQRSLSQSEQPHPELLTTADLVLPKQLLIISHEFKRARFLGLHLAALRMIWPSTEAFDMMDVEYIGIDPSLDERKLSEIKEGDRLRGYGAWKIDLFGNGELLSKKRLERGWDESAFLESLRERFDHDALIVIRDLLRGKKGKEQLNDHSV